MRYWFLVLASVWAAFSPALAAEKPIQNWKPSSDWVLDYADNECRLTRAFGSGADEALFRITQDLSLDRYEVMLVGSAIPKKPRQLSVTVKLGGEPKSERYAGVNGPRVGGSEYILRWFGLPIDSIMRGANHRTMRIEAPIGLAVDLDLKGIKPAMESMKACQDDLLRHWQVDPVVYRGLQKRPTPSGNPGSWATTSDYPRSALAKRQQGIVEFKLRVASDGKIMDCAVLKSSGTPELDERTCQVMIMRAA
jgi:Gram-negative bacterial TonB protein C-terminal